MQFSVPTWIQTDLTITRTSFNRSISFILNRILFVVICIFILCLIRLIFHKRDISIIDKNYTQINLTRRKSYYDFERYLVNNTFIKRNKTRRYFYIDLGCFNGRDADYFVHFHLEEILRYGTLKIISFEPDPINFSACKLAQQNRSHIPTTIHNIAAWTKNGQVRFAKEKGQNSRIDPNSVLYVQSIDFSRWLTENFHMDDFVYVKFTIESAELNILEKLIREKTLLLIDYMEIEWSKILSPDLEVRRVITECMIDNFGMDFFYTTKPVDTKRAFDVKDIFSSIPKDRTW